MGVGFGVGFGVGVGSGVGFGVGFGVGVASGVRKGVAAAVAVVTAEDSIVGFTVAVGFWMDSSTVSDILWGAADTAGSASVKV